MLTPRVFRPLVRVLALLGLVAMGFSANAQTPEKRIALVIGNSAYQDGALATPANDAGLIAQTLQAAGFDVVGARDLDTATMRSSFREFLDKAAASGPDTVAVVYFAGYGLQFEGENYLVPVDARIARDSDVPLAAVRAGDLTKPLAALPLKARIVILDAARANGFGKSGQPLAGGLALMQPDPGSLIAFNAAPGTIGPEGKDYGAYAQGLSEMIKEGGLPLDDLFERVRLRVNELTNGAELAWHSSKVQAPFLFFERTAAAPPPQQARFAELRSKPIHDFDARDAYLAALARDTMRGYEDFLAAYPGDPLAKRVRVILAARREAIVWRESAIADTPDAYWSYLRRYARGPHAGEARRRLSHFAAAFEPPPSFTVLAYDVPPPPPEEIVYVERPVVYFADPVYELPPPPPVPVFFLPPRPAYYVDLPPPPPPFAEFVLPIPVYHPVPQWVERPAYVAPPPVNVVNVNIHNTVVINPQAQTAVVTNPAGQRVPPLPANLMPQQAAPVAPVVPGQAPAAQSLIQQHPVASAAIAAAAVALPAAAALRARQQGQRVNAPGQPPAAIPGQPQPGQPRPVQIPAANLQPQAQPGTPVAPAGAHPLAAPATPPAATPSVPGQPRPALPGQAIPGQPAQNQPRPAQVPAATLQPHAQPGQPAAPNGARSLPVPAAPPAAAVPQRPGQPGAPVNPQAAHPLQQGQPAGAPAARTSQQPAAEISAQQRRQQLLQQQNQAARQRAQQATQQRAALQQAAQQRAVQQQAQRAQQATQQRATQQQAAQQQAQQRVAQQAQQRAAQQQAAQARAQQATQQRAAQQQRAAAQQRAQQQQQHRQNCGKPGQPPCR